MIKNTYKHTAPLSRVLVLIVLLFLNKAKYKDPVTSTWPEMVMDRGPVSLYCNATDGFPAGTINWFDQSGNNWTSNSVLTKDPKDNGSAKSVALSSKLTFKSIFLEWGPFRCIVYNSKHVKVGENYLNITPVISKLNFLISMSTYFT